jgi:hypothetical protein
VKKKWHVCHPLFVAENSQGNQDDRIIRRDNSFGMPTIKIKNPLDPKKDMYSSRQLNQMYESDESSKEHKEFKALIEYYRKNKN